MRTIQSRLLVFVKSFGLLFPTLLIASFALFYFVTYVFRGVIIGFNDAPIWLSLIYKGVNFRDIYESPAMYLSSIAFVSSIVGALWTGFVIPKFQRFVWLQILIIPWIAVILSGGIWGFIWSVNHWPAESFINHETMMLFRRTDIENGLFYSWLSAAQSYPLNILGYGVYCGLLLLNKNILLRNKENKQ